MMTWELIRMMAQNKFEFQMGPHNIGMRGYWATFIKVNPDERWKCDECEERETVNWRDAGHAMTAHRAVVMAVKIALGKQVAVPPPEEFKL